MKFNIGLIIDYFKLKIERKKLTDRLSRDKKVIFHKDKKPVYVLMTYEHYQLLSSEKNSIKEEHNETIINKERSIKDEVKEEKKKITFEMSKAAYEIAKKVYSGQLTRKEGSIRINKETGMNEGSAQAFILIFIAMMDGEVYKRAFNNKTNRFLIESIRKDYGEEKFQKALIAAQKHVDYYSTLGKGELQGYQKIINELKNSK